MEIGTWTDIKKVIKIVEDKTGESLAELEEMLSGQTVLSVFKVTEDDMPSSRLGLLFRRFKTLMLTELEFSEHKLIVNENLPAVRHSLSSFNAVRSFYADPIFLDISRSGLNDVAIKIPEGSVVDASFNNIRSLPANVLQQVRFIDITGNNVDPTTIDPKLVTRVIFMPECYFMTMSTKFPECRAAHAIYYAYRRAMTKKR